MTNLLREEPRKRHWVSRRQPRRPLAPLEPDAFLAWAWRQGPKANGASPCVLADLAFDLGVPLEELRRDWVRLAARVRRNQRLGLEPWEGIR